MSKHNTPLTRRRVLTAIATVGVGGAAAGAGTFAAFSDTESESSGLDAGTLSLSSGGTSSLSFSAGNIKPGDTGTDYASITTSGTLTGDLTVDAILDSTTTGGDSTADLQNNLEFQIWLESPTNTNTSYNSGDNDVGLVSDGTTGTPAYATVSSYAGSTWTDVVTGMSGDWEIHVDWKLPSGTGNEAQGDGLTAKFDLTLNQQ